MFVDLPYQHAFPLGLIAANAVSSFRRLAWPFQGMGAGDKCCSLWKGHKRLTPRQIRPFVSVVIPVFREGVQLSAFLASVRDSLGQCNLPYELVLVDDGSPDETWRVIVGEAKTCQAIRALRLSRNFGKESALCAGLEHARGDAVIVMDADGQHPPSLIPDMVRMWQSSGADIVEAVKRKRGRESLSSKVGALLFYFILNKLSGFHLKGASDFKLVNRKAVDAWLKNARAKCVLSGG